MGLGRARLVGLFALAAGTLVSARAAAQDLGTRADIALTEKRWYEAADLYKQADADAHDPKWVLGLARAEAGAGMLVAAVRHYDYLLSEIETLPEQKPLVDIAHLESDLLAPRLAALRLSVSGAPDAAVYMDGTPLAIDHSAKGRPIDPGWHMLHVTAPGFRPNDERVLALEGSTLEIVIALERSEAELALPAELNEIPPGTPSPPPPALTPAQIEALRARPESRDDPGATQRTAGWVAVGIGSASLLVASFAGINSLACGSACTDGRTSSDIAVTSLVTGLLIGGVGLAFVLSAPDAKSTVRAGIGPRRLTLDFSF